jgi:hypothetical protein
MSIAIRRNKVVREPDSSVDENRYQELQRHGSNLAERLSRLEVFVQDQGRQPRDSVLEEVQARLAPDHVLKQLETVTAELVKLRSDLQTLASETQSLADDVDNILEERA